MQRLEGQAHDVVDDRSNPQVVKAAPRSSPIAAGEDANHFGEQCSNSSGHEDFQDCLAPSRYLPAVEILDLVASAPVPVKELCNDMAPPEVDRAFS